MKNLYVTAAMAFLFLIHTNLFSQNGTLDPDFGTGGKSTASFFPGLDYDEEIISMRHQADGKLVAVIQMIVGANRDILIARYNIDGTIDAGFGTGGFVQLSLGTNYVPAALELQADGRILVGGDVIASGRNIFLLRRLADGSVDNSFGGSGIIVHDLGGVNESVQDIAMMPDGKILVTGRRQVIGGQDDFYLAKLNVDGTFDNTFNGGTNAGFTVTDVSGQGDIPYSIAVQPDGKLLLGGETFTNSNFRMVVVRYNATGAVDASFGTAGKQIISAESAFAIFGLAVLPDGKIVGGGNTDSGEFLAFRLLGTGLPDAGFDTDGVAATSTGGLLNATGVLVQPDGKPVISGYYLDNDLDMAMARFDINGSLDNTFGVNGLAITPGPGAEEYPYTISLLGNRIYQGGTSDNNNGDGYEPAIFAYFNDNFPLPVRLLSFTVQKQRSTVTLKWSADNAIDFSHFELERSTNGSEYANIAVVKSLNEERFTYNDVLIQSPVIFYRLKMVDIDGSFSFSPVAIVRNESFKQLSVFPNPASNQIQVGLPMLNKGVARLMIIDANGRLVLDKPYRHDGGSFVVPVGIGSFPVGRYYVRVMQGAFNESVSFVKQ